VWGGHVLYSFPMLARILGEDFRGDPKWRPQNFVIGGIQPMSFEQGLLSRRRRRHVLSLAFIIPRTRATARHFGSVCTEVVFLDPR
jgi:hypothetical protein